MLRNVIPASGDWIGQHIWICLATVANGPSGAAKACKYAADVARDADGDVVARPPQTHEQPKRRAPATFLPQYLRIIGNDMGDVALTCQYGGGRLLHQDVNLRFGVATAERRNRWCGEHGVAKQINANDQ